MPRGAEKNTKPIQVTYTDTLPSDLQQKYPTAMITYAVETDNTNHRSAGLSNQVQIPLAPTLPAPTDLKASVTADGVVLTWTGIPEQQQLPELQHSYRIYRRDTATQKDALAGETSLSTSSEQTFTDHSFEWQKTYQYRVAAVTTVTRPNAAPLQVEGADSPAVEVIATDIFPPAVPSGLQAVASGVGQKPFIDLTWAPVTDADLAGYNIYRHEQGEQPVKINTDLVKAPAFRDNAVELGRTYIYSVSAVDLRNNESARSEEASETVPNP
jgi:fibronectin type 3 domain-containing protein